MPPDRKRVEAERLYERMRRSQANWRLSDLLRLYDGFGFLIQEGTRHTKVKHVVTLTSSKPSRVHAGSDIPAPYIRSAIRVIGELLRREKNQQ